MRVLLRLAMESWWYYRAFLYTLSLFCGRTNRNSSSDSWVRFLKPILYVFKVFTLACHPGLNVFNISRWIYFYTSENDDGRSSQNFQGFYFDCLLLIFSLHVQHLSKSICAINTFVMNMMLPWTTVITCDFFSVNSTGSLQKLLLVVGKTKPAQV